jgi:hypothetical protein
VATLPHGHVALRHPQRVSRDARTVRHLYDTAPRASRVRTKEHAPLRHVHHEATVQKMLLSLQRKQGKNFIIGTIFLSGLGILKIIYDIEENKITDFEKKNDC